VQDEGRGADKEVTTIYYHSLLSSGAIALEDTAEIRAEIQQAVLSSFLYQQSF
jgi:hypothetical protein